MANQPRSIEYRGLAPIIDKNGQENPTCVRVSGLAEVEVDPDYVLMDKKWSKKISNVQKKSLEVTSRRAKKGILRDTSTYKPAPGGRISRIKYSPN